MDIHEYLALMGVTFGGTMEQKLKGIVFFVVYCNKPKERMMIL
jgi:hypothetical protein